MCIYVHSPGMQGGHLEHSPCNWSNDKKFPVSRKRGKIRHKVSISFSVFDRTSNCLPKITGHPVRSIECVNHLVRGCIKGSRSQDLELAGWTTTRNEDPSDINQLRTFRSYRVCQKLCDPSCDILSVVYFLLLSVVHRDVSRPVNC